MDPAQYDAWYQTNKGAWFSELEFRLIRESLRPVAGESLLDVGCGTGYFTRRFKNAGMKVTGLDADSSMLAFAEEHSSNINYHLGAAEKIPFPDNSFNHVIAITSLCFVDDPVQAVKEMWRVTNKKLFLGLLNKKSYLYFKKHGRGDYAGARWDTRRDVENWLNILDIQPTARNYSSIINIPSVNMLARSIEFLVPRHFLYGGFLSVCLSK